MYQPIEESKLNKKIIRFKIKNNIGYLIDIGDKKAKRSDIFCN